MNIQSCKSSNFGRYARLISGYDIDNFITHFTSVTRVPESGFEYFPSIEELEGHPVFNDLQNNFFGGQYIQLGYCNGFNTKLDSVEYHKCSEICITAKETVFVLGSYHDMKGGTYDTGKMEAFFVPSNSMMEIYPYTLHYAPCDGHNGQGFQVAVALTKGTCTSIKVKKTILSEEDHLLVSNNKWIMTHPEAANPEEGALTLLKGDILFSERC